MLVKREDLFLVSIQSPCDMVWDTEKSSVAQDVLDNNPKPEDLVVVVVVVKPVDLVSKCHESIDVSKFINCWEIKQVPRNTSIKRVIVILTIRKAL